MANKYRQPNISSAVRFEKAPLAELEFSRMTVAPRTYTTYNAGDIVPIRCIEVLPHTNIKMSIDVINRLLSSITVPTMGNMQMDIRAYFVSNREVNDSWKNVTGENTSGYWTAPEVELAPLYTLENTADVQIPVGSVADYYGLPTQKPIKAEVLHNMSDIIFRGYLHTYNEYYRSTAYQPPVPFSKLNIYNGFLDPLGSEIGAEGVAMYTSPSISFSNQGADGTFADGAIDKALGGEGSFVTFGGAFTRLTNFSALDKPLKANKLHDEFTSALPSPSRGPEVFFGVGQEAPVITEEELHALEIPLQFRGDNLTSFNVIGNGLYNNDGSTGMAQLGDIRIRPAGSSDEFVQYDASYAFMNAQDITKTNLITDLSRATGITINDLRRSAAIQQIYEQLGRSGARYREFLRSFFGLNVENVFKDVPTELGHMRCELDLYQVAQTSGDSGGNYQGQLAGYGYTTKNDYLFNYTAIEHGFIHIFCTVRQPNLYSTAVNPYWFRKSTLDWYYPQLANIGEQPMRLALLNPFVAEAMEKSIGFQEAWYEYRYESDICTGYCRTGLPETLGSWTYADNFDENFTHVNGDWLKSNAQEVLDRTLNVTSAVSPQFIACFTFEIEKEIPMPTYSVPGMDIL